MSWRAVCQASREPMVLLDADGRVAFCNAAAERKLGDNAVGVRLMERLVRVPAAVAERWPDQVGSAVQLSDASCVEVPEGLLVVLHAEEVKVAMATFRWRPGQPLQPCNDAATTVLDAYGSAHGDPRWAVHAARVQRSGLALAFHAEQSDDYAATRVVMSPSDDGVLISLVGGTVSEQAQFDTQRQAFLQHLLQYVDSLFFVVDSNHRLTFSTEAFARYAIAREGVLEDLLAPETSAALGGVIDDCFAGQRKSSGLAISWKLPNGEERFVQVEAHGLVDAVGRVRQVLVVGTNITRLAQSLSEKETLLREIHHRVKNNLQIVSSLLALQCGAMPTDAARDIMRRSMNRVRSMALVHQQLYGVASLERIDFGQYAKELARTLQNTLSRG